MCSLCEMLATVVDAAVIEAAAKPSEADAGVAGAEAQNVYECQDDHGGVPIK